MKPTLEVVLITPPIAEGYLGRVNIQRKLKQHVVNRYAKDMAEGRWSECETAICFNQAGELVNGQHRLRAVIRSGVSIKFTVMRNMSEDAILRMDSGTPRTAGDQFQILGVLNSRLAAAVVKMLLSYDSLPGSVWVGPRVQQAVPQSLMVEHIKNHNDVIQNAISDVRCLVKHRMNPTVMGVLHVIVARDSADSDMWGDFRNGLETGANLRDRDPRLALRNYWTRPDLRSWGGSQSHLLIAIRSWNKWVDDMDARQFKMPRREELPMPKVK